MSNEVRFILFIFYGKDIEFNFLERTIEHCQKL